MRANHACGSWFDILGWCITVLFVLLAGCNGDDLEVENVRVYLGFVSATIYPGDQSQRCCITGSNQCFVDEEVFVLKQFGRCIPLTCDVQRGIILTTDLNTCGDGDVCVNSMEVGCSLFVCQASIVIKEQSPPSKGVKRIQPFKVWIEVYNILKQIHRFPGCIMPDGTCLEEGFRESSNGTRYKCLNQQLTKDYTVPKLVRKGTLSLHEGQTKEMKCYMRPSDCRYQLMIYKTHNKVQGLIEISSLNTSTTKDFVLARTVRGPGIFRCHLVKHNDCRKNRESLLNRTLAEYILKYLSMHIPETVTPAQTSYYTSSSMQSSPTPQLVSDNSPKTITDWFSSTSTFKPTSSERTIATAKTASFASFTTSKKASPKSSVTTLETTSPKSVKTSKRPLHDLGWSERANTVSDMISTSEKAILKSTVTTLETTSPASAMTSKSIRPKSSYMTSKSWSERPNTDSDVISTTSELPSIVREAADSTLSVDRVINFFTTLIAQISVYFNKASENVWWHGRFSSLFSAGNLFPTPKSVTAASDQSFKSASNSSVPTYTQLTPQNVATIKVTTGLDFVSLLKYGVNLPKNSTQFIFQVRSCALSVCVLLGSSSNSHPVEYETCLGALLPATFFRKVVDHKVRDSDRSKNSFVHLKKSLVECSNYTYVWFTWDSVFTVGIGKSPGKNVIMKHYDPSFAKFFFDGIRIMSLGGTSDWIFDPCFCEHGTCQKRSGGYFCKCDAGYTGQFCQQSKKAS